MSFVVLNIHFINQISTMSTSLYSHLGTNQKATFTARNTVSSKLYRRVLLLILVISSSISAFAHEPISQEQKIENSFIAYQLADCKDEMNLYDTYNSLKASLLMVTGIVYSDFNSNGIKDNTADYNEIGYEGITITGYGADGTIYGPTISGSDGTYTLAGINQPTRIEFTWTESWLKPSVSGGTTVQFVTGPVTGVSLGVQNGACFSEDAPELITPCYVNGDPLPLNSQAGLSEAIILFEDSSSGINGGGGSSASVLANAKDVGSTYGVAFKKGTQEVFVSAFLKRHVGMGPDGPGAIYKIDVNGASTSLFTDLTSFGINVGTIPLNPARNLVTDPTQPSIDAAVFPLVYKASLGDMDISDDEKFLYVTNLHDRTIYQISIADIENGTAGYNPLALPIPVKSCTNGVARPFGLDYHNGKLYAAYTCTSENGGVESDLDADIFAYDFSTSSWSTSILNIPLDYNKGAMKESVQINHQPWTDDPTDFVVVSGTFNYPQVILSDIVFDYEGSMHFGFRDRTGDMMGYENSSLDGTSTTGWSANGGGDILRSYWDGTTHTLESNGTAGPYTSSGVSGGTNNGNFNVFVGPGGVDSEQGPGDGEFYWADNFFENASRGYVHSEISLGALALRCGYKELATNVYDPLDAIYFAGGTQWYDITTGADRTINYQIFNTNGPGSNDGGQTFAKANGLGDLDYRSAPAPVEIGNLVWSDLNGNGVQDADDPGISGVSVELYDPTTMMVLATATTDANGNYIFSTGSGSNTASNLYDLPLDFGSTYELRIVGAEGGSQQTPLTGLGVTSVDGDATANGDMRDNDGSNADNSTVSFTLGSPGENNHTYDFGFSSATAPCPDPNCANITITNN